MKKKWNNYILVKSGPKNWYILRLITSSNTDQFSNLFTVRIRRKSVDVDVTTVAGIMPQISIKSNLIFF